MAVCAFYTLAFIFHMIWVTFTTFVTYLASSTYYFVVSEFLTLKTLQWSSSLSIVLPILISFGIDGFSKVGMYVWVCIVSSFQRLVTLPYSFIPCFLKAISFSSGVASESSLLLTTPLEVFDLA